MLGDEGEGVEISGGASDKLIGGGNVISGNAGYGVLLFGSDNQVQGNLIGTGPDGSTPLGNGQDGIHINGDANVIGSGATGANVIAHNGFAGVAVESGVGNSIRGNAIHNNA